MARGPHPRVERRVRVLEDDLHVAPGAPQLGARQGRARPGRGTAPRPTSARPAAGCSGPSSSCRCPILRPGRTSRPARSRSSRRRPPGRVERAPHAAAGAAERPSRGGGRREGPSGLVDAVARLPGSGRHGRDRRRTLAGSSRRHSRQRAPDTAGRTRSRTASRRAPARCPRSRVSRRRPAPPGAEASSAFVYGCAGARKMCANRRLLDDAAGVHHGHAVGVAGDDARGRARSGASTGRRPRASRAAGRGSAPESSRRARSSARRR